ncbi:MAG: PhzF family phenazine biosynthesis protein [Blastocatellia bacterium]|nr:PhzF family phenazine biosynthesis protein [Blastocatellia bacterium]
MSSVKFIIADVFTEERFGGNQLAVFTDGRGLDASTMQNIAREMNYAETTFILPPEREGDYQVRIFTPAHELPFAGHPLVGSAYVIVAERMKEWSAPLTSLTLETGVGPIQVEVETAEDRAGRSTMTQPLPVVKGSFTEIERLAAALSIEASEIERTGTPVEAIFNGITTLITPVSSLRAVEAIKIDTGALERISNEMEAMTVTAFTRETLHPASAVHCRVFAPAAGVIEDAATGSANGPLGYYLARHRIIEAEPVTRVVSEQGYEMKRPSTLHIELSVNAETNEVTKVRVGGGVVISGRGEIILS